MSDALARLAEDLRSDPVIAPVVADSDEVPALGRLAAAGPRGAADPATYTLLFEAIREGYLLHYGRSRLLDAADPDLKLLAGDYLYALGLERLASRGDLEAVGHLGDLISLAAQVHARDRDGGAAEAVAPLWLATAVAVGSGGGKELERAKQALRDRDPGASGLLYDTARNRASEAQIDALAAAAESVGFAAQHLHERG
jgi:hypothetical protein